MRILIALPVLNEEAILRETVETVRAFCAARLSMHETVIVIADNGSTDGTEAVGRGLAASSDTVRYLRLSERGKGLAIREAWQSTGADAYVFMDADLSTDLEALPSLVHAVLDGADIAAGSRFHRASSVRRGMARRVFSAGYRALLKAVFGTSIDDAPCGFKAVSASVVRGIVPTVRDTTWFFDTELLLLAEREGKRIESVPVRWSDASAPGRASKVRVGRLIAEYSKQVFALRRRIGEPALPVAVGMRAVIAAIPLRERRFVAAAACVAMLLAALPAAYGAFVAHRTGTTWTGRSVFAPGDTAAYLSQIAQARRGEFLLRNSASEEDIAPTLNPFWGGVGAVSRMTGLSPLSAYTAVRLALIPVFAMVAYMAFSVFFAGAASRLTAFVVFFFGGGLGAYASPFLRATEAYGTQALPMDQWVAEALPFSSMLYSPHFVASWTLLLATSVLSYVAFRSGKTRHAIAGGAAFFALTSFHPFYAVTVVAVCGAYLAVESLSSGFRWRQWRAFAIVCAVAAPAIAYQAWSYFFTGNGSVYGAQNILLTPSFVHVAVGFGVPFLAACASFFVRRELSWSDAPAGRRFLATWFFVTIALLYAPLTFQRRLSEGWFFPMVALATPLLLWAWRRVSSARRSDVLVPVGVTLAALCLAPSMASALIRPIAAYQTAGEAFFFRPDEAAALEWLRERTPVDARVLGSGVTGNNVLGWGERAVHFGHWALTIDAEGKTENARHWYTGTADGERCDFLRTHGITHAWFGPRERNAVPAFVPPSCMEEAFVSGDVTVYRTKD